VTLFSCCVAATLFSRTEFAREIFWRETGFVGVATGVPDLKKKYFVFSAGISQSVPPFIGYNYY
jgi:hypothetical protein